MTDSSFSIPRPDTREPQRWHVDCSLYAFEWFPAFMLARLDGGSVFR